MKFKVLLASSMLLISSSTTLLAQADGEKLLTQLCTSCHVTSGKPTIAPPMFAVVKHVKSGYPTKAEFVGKIVKWVKEPKKEHSVMQGAIRRFGLMPKLPYTESDVRVIAEYLFEDPIETPAWYKEHYKQKHGHMPKH